LKVVLFPHSRLSDLLFQTKNKAETSSVKHDSIKINLNELGIQGCSQALFGGTSGREEADGGPPLSL
jgi:hypothetical protein